METLGRQQLRTRETQARLLDAAEEIFVRDGFEGAQIQSSKPQETICSGRNL